MKKEEIFREAKSALKQMLFISLAFLAVVFVGMLIKTNASAADLDSAPGAPEVITEPANPAFETEPWLDDTEITIATPGKVAENEPDEWITIPENESEYTEYTEPYDEPIALTYDTETLQRIDYNLQVIAGGVVLTICAIFIWFTILKPLKQFIFF